MTLQLGTPLPDVALTSSDGDLVRLRDFVGTKILVVYFYPKDYTPGCTKQACGFRDAYEQFTAAGAEVIGISGGELVVHAAFRAEHQLPFKLLADPDAKARAAFDVGKTLKLVEARVTFVIDRSGLVRHVFDSMLRVNKHIADALAVVRDLRSY